MSRQRRGTCRAQSPKRAVAAEAIEHAFEQAIENRPLELSRA
jgi:hypothetical protein